MQVVFKNENEKDSGGGTNSVDSVICTRKIIRCVKEECFGRFRNRKFLLEYEIAEEFLVDLKKEFEGGREEVIKVAELKRLEQGSKTMEEFVQELKRAVRESEYKKRPLIEEFK